MEKKRRKRRVKDYSSAGKFLKLEEVKKLIEDVVAVSDIASKSKKQNAPLWRGMFCKICSEHTNYPHKMIGEAIGLKHPVVSYWLRTFENTFLTRPDIREKYEIVLAHLEVLKQPKRFAAEMDRRAEKIIKEMLS